MNVYQCSQIGTHCITLRGLMKVSIQQTILDENIIMTKNPSPPASSRITPMAQAIDLLLATETSLNSFHCHPTDLTTVGVESESLAQLLVVIARKQERQLRTDSSDVGETAAQEMEIARELSDKIKPLAKRVAQSNVSAEDVMQFLLQQENPARARRMLLAHIKTPATVVLEHEVLVPAADDPPTGSILVSGEKAHQIKVDILSIDRERSHVTARLLNIESETTLFKSSDCGTQLIHIDVHDKDSFFVLGQCASIGKTVSLTASFDVSIQARAFSYRASLLSIRERKTLIQQLKEDVMLRTQDLF